VLVGGKKAYTVGRVSMDALSIDVTDLNEVSIGDEVVLWGEGLAVESIAEALGLSPYALLTGVTARVLRECVESVPNISHQVA
jgi:alanine racemase